MAHAGGRPTKMTKDVQERIVQAISVGTNRERSAAFAGVSVQIFYAFQAKNPEFQERVKQAEAKCQVHHISAVYKATMPRFVDKTRTKYGRPGRDGKPRVIERVVERTKKEGSWEASMAFLERRWPQEYGRVDRHLIHTTSREGGPLDADYIKAIQRALGMHGNLVPIGEKLLTGGNGAGAIDMDVLPQD